MKNMLFKHRSIRRFRPTPIPEEVLTECLEAASRASTCGNMQLYSLVVTRDKAVRERSAPTCTASPCGASSGAPIRPTTISGGS